MNYKELKEKFGNNFIMDEDTFNKISIEKRESYVLRIEQRLQIISEIEKQQKEFIEKEMEKLKQLGTEKYFKNK